MKRVLLLLLLSFLCVAQELTILHTSDIHGAFGKYDNAWLRIATLIRREIAEHGSENCLVIDTGDVVQGTLLASLTHGKAAIVPLTLLPYDVFVPGNHELDYGIDCYLELCDGVGDKLLSANFSIKGHNAPQGWKLFERGGVKVAVIGIQASYYANWLLPKEAERCRIERGIAALERLLPEVCASKPNVIVLAIHQGWTEPKADARGVNEVAQIAARFPEIDIILGAHTHRVFEGRKIGMKAWYVQPGANGENLGVVKVRLKKGKIDNISSQLISTKDVPEDVKLAEALQPYWELEQKELDRKTGIVLKKEISSAGKAGSGCETSMFLSKVVAWAGKAEIGFHNKLNEYSLYKGRITPIQLYRLVPYENTIVTAFVTVEQLEAILSEQERHRKTYRFNDVCDVKYLPGKKLKIVSIGGKPPELNRKYKIAMNSHLAAGSGSFTVLRKILETPEAQTENTKILVRNAVEEYLRTMQSIDL